MEDSLDAPGSTTGAATAATADGEAARSTVAGRSVGRPRSRLRVAARLLLGALILVSVGVLISDYRRQVTWTRDLAAAYAFVADHPEVSRYLPCFCGCGQQAGHSSVDSCFVSRRDEAGHVVSENAHART